MAYRTFVDRDGSYWQVWDVQPTRIERRRKDRRHPMASRWQGKERRVSADRRQSTQRRITLSDGFSEGWLTFESLREKRRLTPIPANWEGTGEAELRSLCERARRIAKIKDSAHVA